MRTFTILVLAMALAGSAWAIGPSASSTTQPTIVSPVRGHSLAANLHARNQRAIHTNATIPATLRKVLTIHCPAHGSGAYEGLACDGDSGLYQVESVVGGVANLNKFNRYTGALITTYSVAVNGYVGGMCYQGGALWIGQWYNSSSGYCDVINRVDTLGNVLRSITLPSPITGNNIRGVGWNTAGNDFFVTGVNGAINAGDFWECDTVTGAIARTVPIGSIAQWPMSGIARSRGDSLVIWISDDYTNQNIMTINVQGASATLDTMYDVSADFPSGVYPSGICYDGSFLYVDGEQGDDICVYDLRTFNHDVGVSAIRSPVANETPNYSVTPQVVYMNMGQSAETNITVGCWVDSSGTIIYSDSSFIASMAVGDTASISYPNWTVGPAGATYTFTSWSRMAGDMNSANDTMKLTVTAFPMFTTLVAPKGTAPTIDGVINTSEWADANKYDISDVLGNGGGDAGGSPPGSAFLYLKNDSANLYVAVDNNVASSIDYDQIGLYFDDNRDRAWAADSSEGNFWWAYVGTGNRIIYRDMYTYTMTEPVPGMTVAISTSSGHQQYEGLVQIGLKPPNPNYFLNSVVGDTVGFYTYSQYNGIQHGWWPQALPNSGWLDPSQYGDLVLSTSPTGVESQPVIKGPGSFALFASAPNPTKGNAAISYTIPARSEVSLKVYDATGRLVRTLASGTREAGVHSVTLDGRGLSSGVYFYRLQAGNFTATKKLVIAR